MKATGLTSAMQIMSPEDSAIGTQTNMFLCFQVKDLETKGNKYIDGKGVHEETPNTVLGRPELKSQETTRRPKT